MLLDVKKKLLKIYHIITSKRIEYASFASYDMQYSGEFDILHHSLEPAYCSIPNYCSRSNDNYSNKSLERNGHIEKNLIRIKNVSCFAYSDIILSSAHNLVLFELKFGGGVGNEYTRKYTDYYDGVIILDREKYCKIRPWKRSISIPSAIKVGGMFGFNYYHFLFQILPKLESIYNVDTQIPLLLDKTAETIPSFKTLISWANVNNHPLVYMHEKVKYDIGDLIYISAPSYILPNFKNNVEIIPNSALFIKSTLEYIRTLGLLHKSTMNTHKYIFISRRDNTPYRHFNEESCFNILKPLGFIEIYPEQLDISEQITVFNNAEIIVGGTGAAFSNLIFCKENSTAIILTNHNIPLPIFSSIASYVNCKLIYINDKTLSTKKTRIDIQSDFTIEESELLYTVKSSIRDSSLIDHSQGVHSTL